jgi:pimeloyl-ACP methyl ester carboxylesterase
MAQAYDLDVPGARLRYEVTGRGPVLALVGMPMTGEWFLPLAEQLAGDFTVVTFDPRGFGRSAIDDPDSDAVPTESARDLSAVLAAVTHEPAYVVGSSGGAVTGLALLAVHPRQVRTLVAHEPPLLGLLPDAAEQRARTRAVHQTFLEQGAGPAFELFALLVDPDTSPAAPGLPGPPPSEQARADATRMFAHSLLPVTGYWPDLAAVRAASARVVLGRGAASGTRALASRAADALAAELGSTTVEFPGGHAGFLAPELGGDPAGFAQVLRSLLS